MMDHSMSSSVFLLLLLKVTVILCISSELAPSISTPYLLPSRTLKREYERMVSTLKIFPYAIPSSKLKHSLFHSSLISSPFMSSNPNEAHLFYLPLPPSLSSRALDRLISRARSSSPFWNRSLAADHFFLSDCSSPSPSSSSSSARNVVELNKNAVRLTHCFSGQWVPHKDVSLPPRTDRSTGSQTNKYLGLVKTGGSDTVRGGAALLDGLAADPDFILQPLMGAARFCLFFYGGDFKGLGEALAYGCVPVVITDHRPIQDMPLMDVLRWQQMALFLGTSVGPDRLKRILNDLAGGDDYQEMKRLGAAAAHHLAWNHPPKPYDAFHMVMYQLWFRRHAVRYSTSQNSIHQTT